MWKSMLMCVLMSGLLMFAGSPAHGNLPLP